MTSFPLPVIRRVGGLEVKREGEKALRDVIRRVGGLEGLDASEIPIGIVIRRVGGLEVNTPPRGEA